MDSSGARRRRRRATAQQGPPERGQAEVAQQVAAPASPPRAKRSSAPRESPERGLRDLVGGGASQLSESAALRARELNRPTEDDLAAAEREVVIVRRNWKPPVN